jgi:hypothetical protein
VILDDEGKFAEALTRYEETLATCRDGDHPDVAVVVRNIRKLKSARSSCVFVELCVCV